MLPLLRFCLLCEVISNRVREKVIVSVLNLQCKSYVPFIFLTIILFLKELTFIFVGPKQFGMHTWYPSILPSLLSRYNLAIVQIHKHRDDGVSHRVNTYCIATHRVRSVYIVDINMILHIGFTMYANFKSWFRDYIYRV